MGGPRAGLCLRSAPEASPPVEIDNLAAASESGMQWSGHGTMSAARRTKTQATKPAVSSERAAAKIYERVQGTARWRAIESNVNIPRREKNLKADITLRHFWAPYPWSNTGPTRPSQPSGQPGVGPGPGDFHENSRPAPPQSKAPRGPREVSTWSITACGPLTTTRCGPQRQIRDHSAPGDQQLPCFRSPGGWPLNTGDPALSWAAQEVTSLLTHLWITTHSRFTGVTLLHPPNQGSTII